MSDNRPSSLDRIQKLDRAEHLRIEAVEQRERGRVETLESSVVRQPEFEAVERMAKRTDWPLAILGLAWGVLAIILVTTNLDQSAPVELAWFLVAIWVIVVIEYFARLIIAPDAKAYASARRIEPALVAIPTLQFLRLFGLERVSVITTELGLRTKAILLHRGLNRALLTVLWLILFGAWIELLFEDHAPGSNIHDYWNSLWWAIVTLTTVGYGDRYPVSVGGRIVAIVIMLIGIGLLGVVTATVASYFVQEHTDAAKQTFVDGHDEILAQLTVLTSRLETLESILAGTAPSVSAEPSTEDDSGSSADGDPST